VQTFPADFEVINKVAFKASFVCPNEQPLFELQDFLG